MRTTRFYLLAVLCGVALGLLPMLLWPTPPQVAISAEVVSLDRTSDGGYSLLLNVRNIGREPVEVTTAGVTVVDSAGNRYVGSNPEPVALGAGGDGLLILGGELPSDRVLRAAIVTADPAPPITVPLSVSEEGASSIWGVIIDDPRLWIVTTVSLVCLTFGLWLLHTGKRGQR